MPRSVDLLLKGQTSDSLLSVLLVHFFPKAMNAIEENTVKAKKEEIRPGSKRISQIISNI